MWPRRSFRPERSSIAARRRPPGSSSSDCSVQSSSDSNPAWRSAGISAARSPRVTCGSSRAPISTLRRRPRPAAAAAPSRSAASRTTTAAVIGLLHDRAGNRIEQAALAPSGSATASWPSLRLPARSSAARSPACARERYESCHVRSSSRPGRGTSRRGEQHRRNRTAGRRWPTRARPEARDPSWSPAAIA